MTTASSTGECAANQSAFQRVRTQVKRESEPHSVTFLLFFLVTNKIRLVHSLSFSDSQIVLFNPPSAFNLSGNLQITAS